MGMEGLQAWYELYKETALRNGLYLNDYHYFHTMFASKMECADSDVNVQLLVAYHDQTPLAAMFLVLSAHRATYLYGASSNKLRNLMPTYALQWKAMQIAKENHCREYDMFGIAPNPNPAHPMYGLYKFKQGFGGEIYHQLGCWDYPIDAEKYSYFMDSTLGNVIRCGQLQSLKIRFQAVHIDTHGLSPFLRHAAYGAGLGLGAVFCCLDVAGSRQLVYLHAHVASRGTRLGLEIDKVRLFYGQEDRHHSQPQLAVKQWVEFFHLSYSLRFCLRALRFR